MLFRNVPEDGEIYIFSTAGLEVAHITEVPSPTRIWDLTNKSGKMVASGIYIYLVKSESVEHKGKFAVIR